LEVVEATDCGVGLVELGGGFGVVEELGEAFELEGLEFF
jgi:hypothetical protein